MLKSHYSEISNLLQVCNSILSFFLTFMAKLRGLFTKSSDKAIFGSFTVLSSHILRNQLTILWLKYINSTQFLSQTI